MENQHLINALVGVGMSVLGWFARELWSAVKELKADLAKLYSQLTLTHAQALMQHYQHL